MPAWASGTRTRTSAGTPGRTNYVFGEEAARGLYRRWAELIGGQSWAELAELQAAREPEQVAAGV